MVTCRTYKQQFDAVQIENIEFILNVLDDIRRQKRYLNFYCVELRCSLIGGSILGALLITFSILEMFILYANAKLESIEDISAKIWSLENEKTHFNKYINNLSALGSIKDEDAARLKKLYQLYRIPLSHGLRTKGIYEFAGIDNFFKKLLESGNVPEPVQSKDMEEVNQESGLSVIAEILVIISKIAVGYDDK